MVLLIQKGLLATGYDPGTADGIAGRKTIAAIRSFQTDYGLPVNGAADAKTINALFSENAC